MGSRKDESRQFGSRKIVAGAAFVACLSASASAVAAEQQDEGASRQGAIEAGRVLSGTCAACHGEDGNSALPGHPNIAGQSERYLFRQMEFMRDGERDPGLMAGQLDNLTDDNLRDLAAFYASQASQVGQASPENIELGEAIYRGGILNKQVAACTACHAPDGAGNPLAGFPSVSGQTVDYVIAQLKAYREGERTTDWDYEGMMRHTAVNMTDGEIAAVANYLFGLH